MNDRPFASNDKSSTPRAVLWSLAARQSERLLSIVSIGILARVLSPRDFGLVAMATSVAAFVEVLSAFGFDWALLRLPDPSRAHYDAAWTLRVICGLAVCFILVLLAYPAALFLGQRAVIPIVVAMGFNSVVGAIENIWIAEFRRQMRFAQEFKMRIVGKAAGFSVAVASALATHSYWALVAGSLASRVATTVMSYRLHNLRPRWDLSCAPELLRFSGWLLLGNMSETLQSRFSEIWLGRVLGSSSVGFYSMASELSAIASTELAAPINRVMFTSYSRRAGDTSALRDAYLRVSGLIWLLGLPAAIGTGVCANQVVAILLGGQWHEAARVLQILAVAGVLGVMTANTHYVYWAMGRAKFVAALSIIGAIVFVVLTLLSARRYGLLGVAGAQVAAAGLVLAANFAALFRALEMGPAEFVARNYRVLLASIVMGVCVAAIGGILPHRTELSTLTQLISMVSVGVVVYAIALFGLWTLVGRPRGPEIEVFVLLRRGYMRWREYLA